MKLGEKGQIDIPVAYAQYYAAEAANLTAIRMGSGALLTNGKFYTSAQVKSIFAEAMAFEMNKELGKRLGVDYTGLRVMPFVSGNVTPTSAQWGPWPWQEKLKQIWKSMW